MLNFAATSVPLPLRSGHKPTGAKLALKPVHVWGIRIRLQVAMRLRDLALFDLALDSKLRGCDLVALKVSDLVSGSGVRSRVMIVQRKTGRPVQFEVTEQTRRSITSWIEKKRLGGNDWLFPSRSKQRASEHSAVRSAGRPVGLTRRARSSRLRHAQYAPDQSFVALQEDWKPQSLSASSRAHQA